MSPEKDNLEELFKKKGRVWVYWCPVVKPSDGIFVANDHSSSTQLSAISLGSLVSGCKKLAPEASHEALSAQITGIWSSGIDGRPKHEIFRQFDTSQFQTSDESDPETLASHELPALLSGFANFHQFVRSVQVANFDPSNANGFLDELLYGNGAISIESTEIRLGIYQPRLEAVDGPSRSNLRFWYPDISVCHKYDLHELAGRFNDFLDAAARFATAMLQHTVGVHIESEGEGNSLWLINQKREVIYIGHTVYWTLKDPRVKEWQQHVRRILWVLRWPRESSRHEGVDEYANRDLKIKDAVGASFSDGGNGDLRVMVSGPARYLFGPLFPPITMAANDSALTANGDKPIADALTHTDFILLHIDGADKPERLITYSEYDERLFLDDASVKNVCLCGATFPFHHDVDDGAEFGSMRTPLLTGKDWNETWIRKRYADQAHNAPEPWQYVYICSPHFYFGESPDGKCQKLAAELALGKFRRLIGEEPTDDGKSLTGVHEFGDFFFTIRPEMAFSSESPGICEIRN